MNRGWAGAQYPIDVVAVDGGLYCASVDGFERSFVLSFRQCAVSEEVRDLVEVG